MKWIILALCVAGLGCQKTIHEARADKAGSMTATVQVQSVALQR